MNVLVVDDNAIAADSLACLLAWYGHRAAYDGETALKLLPTGAFELTFLDENLPGIKGSAVALSLARRMGAAFFRDTNMPRTP
jgi:CheY-like chemotaxis protein